MDDEIKNLSEMFFDLKLSVSDLCSEVLNLAVENEELKKQNDDLINKNYTLKQKNMELVTLLDYADQGNEDLKKQLQSYMFGSVVD
jgi:regulator of replication initiation timing